MHTRRQYDAAFDTCQAIFRDKAADYGTSWRVFRPASLTDQLFIKAQRIRTLEETGENRVGESIADEFRAIVNYAVIAGIQLARGWDANADLSAEQATALYRTERQAITALMEAKNHDYGEAWRDMRTTSFTDMILTKLLRVKQIEGNDGRTRISEGVGAHYRDMANYALFALIQMAEQQEGGASKDGPSDAASPHAAQAPAASEKAKARPDS